MHDIECGHEPDDNGDRPGQSAVLYLGSQQADDHPGQEQAQEDAEAVIRPLKVGGDYRGNPEENNDEDGSGAILS